MVTEWTGIKGSVAYVSLFKNEVLSLTCTYELPAIWSQFLFLVNACKKVKELSWSCLLSWILNHHILIFVLMPVFLQTNFLLSSMFLVSWMSCYVVYFLVFLCVFSVLLFALGSLSYICLIVKSFWLSNPAYSYLYLTTFSSTDLYVSPWLVCFHGIFF